MKIVKVSLVVITAFLLIACSGFNNPISSESDEPINSQDDSILIKESGGYENG